MNLPRRAGEPALQRVLVGEAQLLDLRLHRRRGLPLVLHRLVAADIDPAAGNSAITSVSTSVMKA